MAKRARIYILCIALLAVLGVFLQYEYFGPQRNDQEASKHEAALRAAPLPDGVHLIETAAFAGKVTEDGEFQIWVSAVLRTDISREDLAAALSSSKVFNLAEIMPYSHDTATTLRLSGIQKELLGHNTDGYFLVSHPFPPSTRMDTRNR